MPLRVIALFLLLSAAASSASSGTIAGTVVDGRGIPIPQATIYLTVEMGGCPSTVAAADSAGRFQFAGAEPGRYRVKAAKVGYVTQEFGEREKGTPGFGATIILTPSAPSANVEITLHHAAQIGGTVYDEDGKALAGGYVFFDNPEVTSQAFFARTGAQGDYWVADLPPGRYYISARRFSEQAHQVVGDRWYYPGTTDKNLATLVALSENRAAVDVRFGRRQDPPGVFLVRTHQGVPVARAVVTVYRKAEASWRHHDVLRTGADGRVAIRTLPAGEYFAYVSELPPPLSSWRDENADAGSIERYAKRFRVAPDQAAVTIDFPVSAGLVLSGSFRMKSGGPPATPHTISLDLLTTPKIPELTGSMSFLIKPARLENEGFLIQGMRPNEPYLLREFHGDHLKPFAIVEIRLDGNTLRGDDIVLSAEAAPHTLEVILDHAAVISGSVASGLKSRSVTARRITGEAPAALHAELTKTEVVNRRFVFRGLPPGTYEVSVPGRERTLEVQVGAGETVEVTLD